MKLGTVPGVYIQEEVNPALAITEQRLKAAGLVGHAAPTLKLIDVEVVHSDAQPDPETGYVTDTLVTRSGADYNVSEILSASDFRNAYGTNILKYTQLTVNEPADPRPAVQKPTEARPDPFVEPEAVADPGAAPVEPTAPVNPGPDATPEEQAQYAEDYAQWEIDHEQWEADYDQWEADETAYTTYLSAKELYDAWVAYDAAYAENPDVYDAWEAYDHAVEVADYKFVTPNKIVWLHPTVPSTENELSVPVAGVTYYVSMIINKTVDYYEPKAFDNIDDVIYTYGPECYYVDDGEGGQKLVLSEISKAARLMFENGADLLYICEVVPADKPGVVSETNVMNAVKKLTEYDIQTVICVPQSKTLQTALLRQVVKDSSMEVAKERVAWISALSDDADDISAQSSSMKEQRIINIAPSKVTISAEDASGVAHDFEVSSIYAAAALTGMTVDNTRTVAEPLTRKNPSGIYGISKQYVRKDIEKMSKAGTTVLVLRNQAVSVNQAVTTDNTNQNNREVSVVLIKDEVMKAIRENLDSQYIGHFYDRKRTPGKIKLSIQQLLDGMIGSLVEGYNQADIVVTPDPYETTQINIKLAFAVLRPLNYIYISFMVTI